MHTQRRNQNTRVFPTNKQRSDKTHFWKVKNALY